ncbi:unnamed protein product, partial [Brassica oleracea]
MEEIQIPERMFATGEEPAGERFMRNTTFGKIISQAENPSFSGTFGQFVIVRM